VLIVSFETLHEFRWRPVAWLVGIKGATKARQHIFQAMVEATVKSFEAKHSTGSAIDSRTICTREHGHVKTFRHVVGSGLQLGPYGLEHCGLRRKFRSRKKLQEGYQRDEVRNMKDRHHLKHRETTATSSQQQEQ
jgi:hypothetical protein